MLEVKNVSCVRQSTPIISNLSLTLFSGNFLLIKGINGSGKTTLLKLLAGLSMPCSGSIICKTPQQIHYLGHQNGLKLDLSVQENLMLRLALQNIRICPDSFQALLNHLDLDSMLDKTLRTLSAGQQRRVALSLLWLAPKKIWLLDEPLTSLDETTTRLFKEYLEKHLQEGGIAVISTHQSIDLANTPYQELNIGDARIC